MVEPASPPKKKKKPARLLVFVFSFTCFSVQTIVLERLHNHTPKTNPFFLWKLVIYLAYIRINPTFPFSKGVWKIYSSCPVLFLG